VRNGFGFGKIGNTGLRNITIEKELTQIDLFSGIGGFTLAAEWAGFKTIAFCEKEPFCQKVLQKRFGAIIADSKNNNRWKRNKKQEKCKKTNNGEITIYPKRLSATSRFIPIIPEIRDFDGTKYRGAALLTGGFPCQPFSVAGQRRGKEDDRYLWPEMLRVISEAKPRWILAENVPGIFRMELDTVLADLEGEGYTVGTFIIPACGLNAPHRRNRIWIVANSIRPRTWNQNGKINDQERRISQNRRESIRQKDGEIGTGRITPANSHAPDSDRFNGDNAGFSPGEISQFKKTEIQGSHPSNTNQSRPQIGEMFGQNIQQECPSIIRDAWQENWLEVATRFCRVDDGISDRIHRLKALGNAIVPQIAYEILKNIAWIERHYD